MHRSLALLLLSLLCLPASAASKEQVVFRNCTLIDGSGEPAFPGDLLVENGRIKQSGNVYPSKNARVVDCGGKAIAPGFIDLHNHSVKGILNDPQASSQVSQGITTIVVGADGDSPYPLRAYLNEVAARKPAINIGIMVGHGTLRRIVLGEDYRRPAEDFEIAAMASLVRLAMSQGAFGLSAGLEYDPGFYSTTGELVALAAVAREFGGFYMPHIRDEEEGFLEALEETIEIAQKAEIAAHISHLKLGNPQVSGQADRVLRRIGRALEEGLDLTADVYPYTAWASDLSILLPSRNFDDPEEVKEAFERVGGADRVQVTSYSYDRSFEFRDLQAIAEMKKVTPVALFQEMMRNGGASIIGHTMSESDVEAFYQSSLVMVASDGGIESRHPRKSGTFPRVLRIYVREKKILSLEEAIHKMTQLPAQRLGLRDRGLLRPGYRADLVLFDPEEISDHSTFQDPERLATGIAGTYVNGVSVWDGAKPAGQRTGQILLRTAQPDPTTER